MTERCGSGCVVWLMGFLCWGPAGCAQIEAEPTLIAAAVGDEAPPTTDGDWPAFRGPNRNGITTESDWTASWPAEGPRRLWTAEVGLGYSAVSVDDGRAYTLGNRDGQETVYCFDAATGREYWKHTYPAVLIDNLHLGGPGASPTIDGERVYVVGKEGHLHCYDAGSGRVVWKVHFVKDLGAAMPEWGFCSSPLVQGGLLIIDVAGPIALSKETGKLVWRSERQRPGYGSPIVVPGSKDETLVADLTNDALLLVRAVDGVTVASYPWSSDYVTTATTPVVGGRTLFISSGYGAGCALLELGDGGLTPLFRNKELSSHMCTPVLWQGHYYGIDGNSHNARACKLVCLDAKTGRRTWEQRGFGCGSLMLADGKLLVLSDEGYLSIARATPTAYEEIARTRVFDAHTWTMPVLARGRIYCRSESGTVVCLDVAKMSGGK